MNSRFGAYSRRDFAKLCGLAGLGLAAPGVYPTAHAEQKEAGGYDGPFYVVYSATGGWDTTYLMDPKGIDGINRLYQEDAILTHGTHRFAPTARHIQAGMSNEDFFREFGRDLLVMNGLDYSVNNHGPGSRYMATGKLDSLAYPTFAALVAACNGPQCPLAFLTFGDYSNTGDLVPMSRIPYLPALQKIANADSVGGKVKNSYHQDFVLDRIEGALEQQLHRQKATPQLPRVERTQSMLYAAQLNSKSLQRITSYIPATIPKEPLSLQAEVALASFKAGVCVSANLMIDKFDTHSNNDKEQMRLIPELLAGIAYLVRRAEELKIREKLVIVVQSEMGRTPNYNKGEGKDHWSIGSIMFMGQRIRGDRVIGATDEKQFSAPLDPVSLRCEKEKGIRVRPEHIHLALRDLAGIGNHPLSAKFPLLIPEKERLRALWG